MAWQAWTSEELDNLKKWRAAGVSFRECAEKLGRSYGSVKNKCQHDGLAAPSTRKTDERFEHETRGDAAVITSVSDRIKTPADALAYAEIDAAVWEIDRQVVNAWESAAKTADGIETRTLWQVKVWLKRRVAAHVSDALDRLFERGASWKPAKPKPQKAGGPYLVELSLFDAHFGKLAYDGKSYDTKTAERVFSAAVGELLDRLAGWKVASVLIPVGNDFFNVDNWKGETARGTRVDNDGPFAAVFESGCLAMVAAIDRCLQRAPVELLWVPGNHDPSTSWYMMRFLQAWYRSSKAVTVDQDMRPRKYRRHGCCLLGFTHGDQEAHRDLPTIMAAEVPEMWAASAWREIHLGHFHRAKQTVHKTTDEFGGVRVRVLPSLSGTDRWHYAKGYVGAKRAAEAYLWHATDGYAGHVSANVQT